MKALITGATRGIGKAISEFLASEGYELILIARSEEVLISLAGELVELGSPYVEYIAADLSTSQGRADVLDVLEGDVDLLINNLGIFHEVEVNQISSGILHEQMCKNVYPAVDLTQSVYNQMLDKNRGTIIFIGSITSEVPMAHASAYTLSKSLLSNYVSMLQNQSKQTRVRVSEIIPSAINTSSWDGIEAPKEQFLQEADLVAAVKSIIFADSNVVIDRIQLSSKILED